MSFVTDIQLMMHGFGDCRKPLRETAAVIESIVHQQMTVFLHQATDIAEQRGQRVVGPEDILFVMRRDPLKLQRLVHYMGVRDLYQKTRASTSTPSTGDPSETPGEVATPPEVSRKKLCINFLQTIDQTGQYEPLYSSSIQDPVKAERISRLDSLTQGMSFQRYKEYCEARRASFCPRLRVNKFRDWLLGEENSDVKLTQSGSLQEIGSGDEHCIGMDPITPPEVREAMRRYWGNSSVLAPFSKIRSPISTKLLAA
ncbi:transcription initiation protein SPT3 homolog isoform X2 [Eriocheir sinensis]|uniref:transcription initiation protein SPT3 homolog isoform X2 n=1 Tax=Eriocheir sinensis TaxID=95602 RepID=UPI0021C87FEC|nr:transcription initiation protein SPT3 homolog isoform X2 [Eriocheir sinensis]